MEKMLVTQALDERELLEKKIKDKIQKASFVDCIKRNEERVIKTYKEKTAYMLFGKLNEPTFFKLNAFVFETIYTDI